MSDDVAGAGGGTRLRFSSPAPGSINSPINADAADAAADTADDEDNGDAGGVDDDDF